MAERNPIKLCLVGCGRIARSHTQAVRELKGLAQIVCAVGTQTAATRSFCEEEGIARLYATLEEALAQEDFEAVVLCLPNHLHKDFAIACFQAGKHVLVEKPMANTLEECDEMIRAADQAGRILMIGQSRRFYDAVFASKGYADAGEDGRLISITAELMGYLPAAPTPWWNEKDKAGGLMIPIWGSHIIDYVLWMFGEAPSRVYCEAYSLNPSWEGEDEVTILMGYPDDRFATVKMSWNTRVGGADWKGEGKMLSSKDILYRRYVQLERATLVLDDETLLTRNGAVVAEDAGTESNFAREYREFVAAIQEGRRPVADGREIRAVIQVQEAALRSAREHCVVTL